MKKSISAIALTIFLGFFGYTNAKAQSVEFVDNTIHFDSYTSIWAPIYPKDEYGTPKIYSLTVNWNDNSGLLEKVIINLHDSPERQLFDSLFINTDYGTTDSNIEGWDYFVLSGINAATNHVANTTGTLPGSDGLYSVTENYNYTTNLSGGRKGHATGIDTDSLNLLDAGITGSHPDGSFTITYDFSSVSIQLGENFAIAYAPWCANDVILVSHSAEPVPEPATMLLFGVGLSGLASATALKRRKPKNVIK